MPRFLFEWLCDVLKRLICMKRLKKTINVTNILVKFVVPTYPIEYASLRGSNFSKTNTTISASVYLKWTRDAKS